MKNLAYFFFMFLLSWSSLAAQTYYSSTLNEMFYGPDNVVVTNKAYKEIYLSKLTASLEKLKHELTKSETKLESIEILSSLHDRWKNFEVGNSRDMIVRADYIPEARIRQRTVTKTIDDKVISETYTISSDDAMSKWPKINRNTNCLSAVPKDCLMVHLQSGALMYVDDYGNKIASSYFHDNFENIDYDSNDGKVALVKRISSL